MHAAVVRRGPPSHSIASHSTSSNTHEKPSPEGERPKWTNHLDAESKQRDQSRSLAGCTRLALRQGRFLPLAVPLELPRHRSRSRSNFETLLESKGGMFPSNRSCSHSKLPLLSSALSGGVRNTLASANTRFWPMAAIVSAKVTSPKRAEALSADNEMGSHGEQLRLKTSHP